MRMLQCVGRRVRRVGFPAVLAGVSSGLAYHCCATGGESTEAELESSIAQLQRQADKARQRAQERVHFYGEQEMLGMTPKLWLEALDEHHRYGSILYPYWQRWEASSTRWMFFDWLDNGRGALIDLPSCPRRLLEEARTIYMTREQLDLCRVRIRDGLLVWEADGEPVTLPERGPSTETVRARAIAALVEERLTTTRRRERLLREARAGVMAAMRDGTPATPERLKALTEPLVSDGLLRRLRDPHFVERARVLPTMQDEDGYRRMWERFKAPHRWTPDGHTLVGAKADGPAYELPASLLPNLGWGDVLQALDHEEGHAMRDGPLQTAEERQWPNKPGKGGIFAIDMYGQMTAAHKVSGALHHSSLTGGKCCRFAGAITVEEGRVRRITPHSGHYVPTQAEYDALIESWRHAGLDLAEAEIGGLVKDKRRRRDDAAAAG